MTSRKQSQKASFSSWLSEAQQVPAAALSNLQLAGVDDATIQLLLDAATELADEDLDDREVDYFGIGSSPGYIREYWSQLRSDLTEWWSGISFVEDSDREPTVIAIEPTLYCVAVASNLPGEVTDLCTWSTSTSRTGGVELSLGIPGFSASTKMQIADTKTVVASPGEAMRIYLKATVELKPTRLYVNGKATELEGNVPTDVRITEPLSIAAAPLLPFPRADALKQLRGYPKQNFVDPEPPVYKHTIERGAKFALTLPLAAKEKTLGLSLEFSAAWSAEHKLTLAGGSSFLLLQLDAAPGTMLVTDS